MPEAVADLRRALHAFRIGIITAEELDAIAANIRAQLARDSMAWAESMAHTLPATREVRTDYGTWHVAPDPEVEARFIPNGSHV